MPDFEPMTDEYLDCCGKRRRFRIQVYPTPGGKFVEAVEQRANVEARLLTQGDVGDLPDEVEEQLFHIAQEALNNALRHSAATEVTVRIAIDESESLLIVEDNGTGFDPDADSAGMGLTTMQERVEAIGGQVRITSAPDQGTTVEVAVAMKPDEGV